jgi:hypothetical protein
MQFHLFYLVMKVHIKARLVCAVIFAASLVTWSIPCLFVGNASPIWHLLLIPIVFAETALIVLDVKAKRWHMLCAMPMAVIVTVSLAFKSIGFMRVSEWLQWIGIGAGFLGTGVGAWYKSKTADRAE